MTFAGYTLRSLAGLHPRSLATVAGIAIAVATLVALVGLARGVSETLLDSLEARGAQVVVTEAGALDLMSSLLPEDLADRLAAHPGVSDAAPELARLTSLPDGTAVAVVGWPAGSFAFRELDLVRGRWLQPDDRAAVLLGSSFADKAGLAPGDSLMLFQAPFVVVGLVDAGSVLARNLAYVPLAQAQALTFRDGQATSVLLRLVPDEPDAREALLADLRASFPGFAIEASESLARQYTFGRIAQTLSLTISAVAMLAAVLVIFNTMSMAVTERRAEFALLSAIGWARWRIVAAILGEGTLLSLVGGLAGGGLGVATAHVVAHSSAAAGFIAPVISPGLLAVALGLSALVGLVGALVPALRATGRPPADVLRAR